MYRFVVNWRCYVAGQVVDLKKIGMNTGQIETLLARGTIVRQTEKTTASYTAMIAEEPQAMVKRGRGRPLGSKNKVHS